MNNKMKKIMIFVIVWYLIISTIFLCSHSTIVEKDLMLPAIMIWMSLVIFGICISPIGSQLFNRFFKD